MHRPGSPIHALPTDSYCNAPVGGSYLVPGKATANKYTNLCSSIIRSRYIGFTVKYLIGLGLLGWVVSRHWNPDPGPGLKQGLAKEFHPDIMVLAAAIYLFGLLLQFIRWHALARAQDLPCSLYNAVRLGFIGFFWNNALPAGSIGGDIVKATFFAREQNRRTVAVATVLVDRAIGLWGLIWVVLLLGSAFWLAGDQALQAPASRYIINISAGIIAATVVVW